MFIMTATVKNTNIFTLVRISGEGQVAGYLYSTSHRRSWSVLDLVAGNDEKSHHLLLLYWSLPPVGTATSGMDVLHPELLKVGVNQQLINSMADPRGNCV